MSVRFEALETELRTGLGPGVSWRIGRTAGATVAILDMGMELLGIGWGVTVESERRAASS